MILSCIVILLSGCSTKSHMPYASLFFGKDQTLVTINTMEDHAQTPASKKTAHSLSQAVSKRLAKNGTLTLTSNQNMYVVNMKLLQHDQLPQSPPEVAMSIQLEILDMRSPTPEVILHEVISMNTLLDTPLTENHLISWDDEFFRISPLGLSHAKLSREIATRIEDYINLSRKG